MNLLTAILSSYIVTCVLTKGHIFLPARKLFRRIMWRTPLREMFTVTSHMSSEVVSCPDALVVEDSEPIDDEIDEIRTGFDFASCLLYCGFYVSMLAAWLLHVPLEQWLMVYGASYFMATQERQ